MLKCSRSKLLLLLACCMTIMTGCVEQKPLEKLGLITTAGYDLIGKEQIKGIVVVQKFDPMAKSATKVISAISKTSKGLRQAENLKSNQKLVSGQLRSVVYSRELAEKGIIQLVDTLNRDAAIGNMVYLTIADQTAEEIMKIDYSKTNINLGTYIYNLIKQNVEGEQIISPTLQEFNHNYYDIGKDPVLPILKMQGGDVVISGVGLFREDRLVDELKQSQLFFLKILVDKYKAGTLELGFKKEELQDIMLKGLVQTPLYNNIYLTIDNIRSKSKIKLIDKQNLKFKVEIKLDSRLLEMTEPLDLSKPATVKLLEKKMNKAMEKQVEDLLYHLRELDIDPIGFGNEYEVHYRGQQISKEKWRELYKKAEFDVQVKNRIEKTGVID
ncbi:Ger(x)C family spore germination protein [Neobacillus sp. PS2-9]|uniref:Ger(x)C family spore germination protein n=1 Tax=Neobacillus sp. PS2-9 TaxID=3070676 RepID=UPI0027DEFDA9|nr:Ger(x)C family spore germination protein [Neobacillus sp. PS2-9]WML60052.1 Ger(x)C family spore germination protein [Neobacillus sp. PS2-9]